MFERFTDSARRAVATAGQTASYQRQEEIGTNHLLFGVVAAADELGSNHVGAEHLLAGLVGGTDDQAGRLLASLGMTEAAVLDAIASTGSPSPSSARSFVVYLPVGKSVFKNGGRIYPDLAAATAAHPDQDIAPFPLTLADGEFFTLVLGHNGNKSVGSYASYRDAFAAVDAFRTAQGVTPTIRIMSPDVTEHRGKDSNGRDVVLGRTVEYDQHSLMSRVVTPHEAKAAKAG